MSGTTAQAQPKASTPEGMRIEKLARWLLSWKLPDSIEEEREYGGVIWRDEKTGKLGYTGPFPGYAKAHVDVHVWDDNRGCPPGTKAVAWYHTHPVKTAQLGPDTIHFEWDKFIGGDKLISDSFLLPGYVATMDGRFWRYDHPAPTMVDGVPTPTEGEGSFNVLNGKIPTVKLPAGVRVAPPL